MKILLLVLVLDMLAVMVVLSDRCAEAKAELVSPPAAANVASP